MFKNNKHRPYYQDKKLLSLLLCRTLQKKGNLRDLFPITINDFFERYSLVYSKSSFIGFVDKSFYWNETPEGMDTWYNVITNIDPPQKAYYKCKDITYYFSLIQIYLIYNE